MTIICPSAELPSVPTQEWPLTFSLFKIRKASNCPRVATQGNSAHGQIIATVKGQLISECIFNVLNFPKKNTYAKNWQISALESKKWCNQQNKGTFLQYYNLHIILWAILCIKNIIECLYLMIWQLFRFLGRNLSNFCVGFLENLRHQKYILKLTDL